jgi:hypothetical protein
MDSLVCGNNSRRQLQLRTHPRVIRKSTDSDSVPPSGEEPTGSESGPLPAYCRVFCPRAVLSLSTREAQRLLIARRVALLSPSCASDFLSGCKCQSAKLIRCHKMSRGVHRFAKFWGFVQRRMRRKLQTFHWRSRTAGSRTSRRMACGNAVN